MEYRPTRGLLNKVAMAAAATLIAYCAVVPAVPSLAAETACAPPVGYTNCVLYTFSGGDQTFKVPTSVTSIHAEVFGSGGQNTAYTGTTSGVAGAGGLAAGDITGLTGTETLTVTVGGTNGFGGGGPGGVGTRPGNATGGSGGGFSAIWQDQTSNTPYLLAGGGGGAAGANNGSVSPIGGSGGGNIGGPGLFTMGATGGGGGGTAVAGGAAGVPGATGGVSANDATAGSAFLGGAGGSGADGGGGGGGGYFGGGGGSSQTLTSDFDNDGGGGGGSGFLGAVTGGALTAGAGAAANVNGSVQISWNAPAPVISSPTSGTTTGGHPPVTGTAVPGNTVTISDGVTTICTAVASSTGNWTCPPLSFPDSSSQNLVATQTDQPGNPLLRYPPSTTVSFDVAVASAATSTIAASPTTITADGISTSIITVTLRDSTGAPLSYGGDSVVMTPTAGTLTTPVDVGNGSYTAMLTSPTTVGSSAISFTVNNAPAAATTTVAFTVGAASTETSTIGASPTTITADGSSSSTITVTLKDANGNLLTSGGDRVAMIPTSGTLSTPVDLNNGTYSAILTSPTVVGSSTISFTVNDSPATATATVDFTVGAASTATSTISASPTEIIADGSSTSKITVALKDGGGNALTSSGGTVVMSATEGKISATVDNNDGTYTALLTAPKTEGRSIVSFTVNGNPAEATASVTFTPRLVVAPELPRTGSELNFSVLAPVVTLSILAGIILLVARRRRAF